MARQNRNRAHNGLDHISTINPRLSVALYHFAEGLSSMDICDDENNRFSVKLLCFCRRSCVHAFGPAAETIGVSLLHFLYSSRERQTDPHFCPVKQRPWRSGKREAAKRRGSQAPSLFVFWRLSKEIHSAGRRHPAPELPELFVARFGSFDRQ